MDSTGQELHPNWRTLTTLHVPLKRFVSAGAIALEKDKAEKHVINGISGAEVQQFYKEILDTPATKKINQNVILPPTRAEEKLQLPFDANKFFRLSTSNNVKELSQMCITEEAQVNCCDVFGWTALMMAACEGAMDSTLWLLQIGAKTDIQDKSGHTALDLAKRKGHESLVKMLEMSNSHIGFVPDHEEPIESTQRPFYCKVCLRDYKESTWRAHQTSTVHQFNMKALPSHKLHKFNISARNRGLQLMVKQGWDREHGLGPTQSGRLYPVKTVLRKQRTGLGIEQPPARVTHFKAFDTNATKHLYRHRTPLPQQPLRTRNEMKREKLRDWRRERRLRNELS